MFLVAYLYCIINQDRICSMVFRNARARSLARRIPSLYSSGISFRIIELVNYFVTFSLSTGIFDV